MAHEQIAPEKTFSGRSGRPTYAINEDDIQKFLDMEFTVQAIANMLGVSKKTIDRRIRDFNIRAKIPLYTDLSSDRLDNEVVRILKEFPNSGIRNVKGHLRGIGIKVGWEDVRCSLWRVDPQGILNRSIQQSVIKRRVYFVAGPLALLHIDGNHKLIRWKLVVHGGIE